MSAPEFDPVSALDFMADPEGNGQASREQRALVVAQLAVQRGATEREVQRVVTAVAGNDAKKATRLAITEEAIAKPADAPRAGRLRSYDLGAMSSTEPPPVPWVVEPLAALGEVTVLYGKPGLGKSLLCLGLASAVANGERIAAGMRCTPGRSLYIDAENGEPEIHRRVKSLEVDPQKLAIHDGIGVDLIRHFDDIEAVVHQHRPSLVVLDSLRRLMSGAEENDSGAMAEALGFCKFLAQRQRVAVVVVHHPKKSGEAYRGSSAIADQTSILYRLDKQDGDMDPMRRSLSNEKMRIAAPVERRFVRVGVEDGGLVVEDAFPPKEGELTKGPAQRDLLPQILEVLADAPSSRAQVAKALGREKSDGTVRRAFDRLEEQGQIEQQDGGVWARVAKQGLPSSSAVGKGVAKSLATGNTPTTEDGKGVAKSSRARQPRVGNPNKKGASAKRKGTRS